MQILVSAALDFLGWVTCGARQDGELARLAKAGSQAAVLIWRMPLSSSAQRWRRRSLELISALLVAWILRASLQITSNNFHT